MDLNEMIFETLKEVQRDVQDIKEKQIEQGYDIKENKNHLADHMRRTELAEARLDIVEQHQDRVLFFFKIMGGFATLIGVIYTSIQLIGYLSKS